MDDDDDDGTIEKMEKIGTGPHNEINHDLLASIALYIEKVFSISWDAAILPAQRIPGRASDPLKTNEYFYGFQCKTMPPIDVKAYLLRIAEHGQCSDEVFVLACIYVLRLHQRYGSSFPVNVWSVHRILFTCILLAVKFFDDILFNNQIYSMIGGIPLKELNALEVDLLTLLEFNLFVCLDEFDTVCLIIKSLS